MAGSFQANLREKLMIETVSWIQAGYSGISVIKTEVRIPKKVINQSPVMLIDIPGLRNENAFPFMTLHLPSQHLHRGLP